MLFGLRLQGYTRSSLFINSPIEIYIAEKTGNNKEYEKAYTLFDCYAFFEYLCRYLRNNVRLL